MSNEKRVKVAITQGDINGIGYEVIFKTLADTKTLDLFTPVIYGSSKVAAYHRKALNISNFSLNNVHSGEDAIPKRVNIVNCLDDNVRVELGKATETSGKAAFDALKRAVEDLKRGAVDVLVTAPINKHVIQSEQFAFPGHTEFLAEQFNASSHIMLMVSSKLKVGVVTGHIPLKEVAASITTEKILEKIRVLDHSLRIDFTIRKPRIAVLGLNPHAGDNGLIGDEENNIIIPAIEAARNEGIMALGPYPADGLFGSGQVDKFDAVLAMYHDQGLAPFKSIGFSEGVNYTAGLPIVRTSPDHGTAYEIAGENKADPESFRQAVYLAIDIFKRRKLHGEISANPLKKVNLSELEGGE
ncbi:4-hydroxythreonine-4-phosphate dehydrogenase PdxA [Thermophagus xiamenensis]|uniref:4-hydroxythreonine-4-phosphate dehydrogenase n=1 Tax=Thermophagus xiamenensis TaxID=385682 RepID=A0A1I1Y6E5_9BACT|nr:4-hydroxythreonine-4-phosphate dehydrogenase PdxA [Thermophagus xiamenensis]SFE14999.1 4-hydroxythreonine-4-phosphate dehydrogenase [Thermophagus xiamenensis]